jgi:hypothetical protein
VTPSPGAASVMVCGVEVGALDLDDDAHGQVVGAREVEVALVVGGHRHDRAGAVVHEHVVGGVDRQRSPLTGLTACTPRNSPPCPRSVAWRSTSLLRCTRVEEGVEVLATPPCSAHSRALRVLGRHHEERRPVQRVGAGGVDDDLLVGLVDREGDLRALAAADPVALQREHALRPRRLELRHVVEQPLGERGDRRNHCVSAFFSTSRRSARSGRRRPARWRAPSGHDGHQLTFASLR